jgi:hypothetical protein
MQRFQVGDRVEDVRWPFNGTVAALHDHHALTVRWDGADGGMSFYSFEFGADHYLLKLVEKART